MSQVAIEKIDETKIGTASVFEDLKVLSERIRRRAFEFFEGRHGGDGFDKEDWLRAERDLLCAAESDLVEKDGRFEVRINAPGFEAAEVKVTALPDALIVKADSIHTHDERDGNVRFCEFSQKTLFRRFDLPAPINVDKVTADLNKGVLHLTAAKAKQEAAAELKSVKSIAA
jgi:HSP20 family molecular chaperone IbpA